MFKLYKQQGGNTAHVQYMAGGMLSLSKNQQQAGLQLFLYLNLIGKYAWQLACQQVFYSEMLDRLFRLLTL